MNNRPTLNTLPVPDLPAPLPSDENDSDSPVRGANERQAAIAALLRSCSTENASVGDSPPPIVGVKVDEEVMQQEAVQADLAGLVMSCSDCGCDLTIAEIDEHDCSAYSVSVAEIQLDVGDPTRHQTDLGTGAGESVDSASAYLSPNPQAQKAQKAQSLGITVTAVGGGCFTEVPPLPSNLCVVFFTTFLRLLYCFMPRNKPPDRPS